MQPENRGTGKSGKNGKNKRRKQCNHIEHHYRVAAIRASSASCSNEHKFDEHFFAVCYFVCFLPAARVIEASKRLAQWGTSNGPAKHCSKGLKWRKGKKEERICLLLSFPACSICIKEEEEESEIVWVKNAVLQKQKRWHNDNVLTWLCISSCTWLRSTVEAIDWPPPPPPLPVWWSLGNLLLLASFFLPLYRMLHLSAWSLSSERPYSLPTLFHHHYWLPSNNEKGKQAINRKMDCSALCFARCVPMCSIVPQNFTPTSNSSVAQQN